MSPAELQAARAEHYRRVRSDPTYRHTAQRWRDHLAVWPDCDQRTRDNCAMLIAQYEATA